MLRVLAKRSSKRVLAHQSSTLPQKCTVKCTRSASSSAESVGILKTTIPVVTKDQESFSLMGSTWSSPYDRVSRQKFSKEIMRLWSLLELCLASEDFTKAMNILDALYPLSKNNNFDFVEDLNKFLEAYSTNVELSKAVSFVTSWSRRYGTDPNAKTFAILINKAIQDGKPYKRFLDAYTAKRSSHIKELFSNVDVFGIDNLKLIFKEQNYSPEDLPAKYRDIVFDSAEESEIVDLESTSIKSIEKDAEDLKAVDTFGLKVIRRTLLSLESHQSKSFIEEIDKNLNGRLNFLTSDNTNSIDFYKIYKTLNEEEKESFDQALDAFNQDRQRALENNALSAARERWKHEYEEIKARGDINFGKSLNARLWEWSQAMVPLVQAEIDKCKKIESGFTSPRSSDPSERLKERQRNVYAPYMSLLSAEKTTSITILELLKLNSTGGVSEGMRTARAVLSVSKALEMEFRSERLLSSEQRFKSQFKPNKNNLRKYTKTLMNFKNDKLEETLVLWPQEVRVKIGSILVSILMSIAKISVKGQDPTTGEKVRGEAPAFYHSYQYFNGSRVGILKIHKSLSTDLSSEKLIGLVQPQLLPMLIKPRPWTSWRSGGYYDSESILIRTKESPEQMAYLQASSNKLQTVYEGLNILGNTSWTINRRVFEIMSKFWNKGEKFLDIPPIQTDPELPPRPAPNSDPTVINEWKKEIKRRLQDYADNKSTRCDANYKLEIARAYLGEKFYFPHNLDFRGRAYPLSPIFNHIGNDLSRGLLLFWRGKKLGPTGLDWLKVHLSNLFGIDKAPLEERVQFVNDNVDKVFKTADDPLGYQDWWTKADKPWQALATIFELADALRSPNPEEFVSHQPVHQDGTCNGLQHYAALGGDIEGATQVNLVPSDRPQDVYTYVANLVRKRLEKEAEKGEEKAKVILPKLKRKVVKQTVMTNVYGVTFLGATRQIDKQLNPQLGEESYIYSTYLAKHVFHCIRELFEGAHLIQDWLAICAKMITRSIRIDMDQFGAKPSFMASVIWTTPLNLPIVQPYRAINKRQIETNLQSVFITDPFEVSQVDSRKQMAAFPPNFIHSLDASHMLLSAISCGQKGLDFAAVHDSYWTHAGDVDIMNACLREEFIQLHEVDLISKLKNEFDQRYKGFVYVADIPVKSKAAIKIKEVRAELSERLGKTITLADEFQLERERQRLLNSDDSEEVKKGMDLKTTVSIFDDQDLEQLISQETVDGIDMGIDESTKKRKKFKALIPLVLPDIPPKGDFDVHELRNSKYFFS